MPNLIKDIKCNSPRLSTCISLRTVRISAVDRKARKPYRRSGKRPVMSRCLAKLSLIKDSKILLIIGRRLMGRYLPGSDLSPSTGTIEEDFRQKGKQDSAKHLLCSLARTGENSGEHIIRTMAGILSGQVALDASRS